jgi:N-formylglutamate deformylase
MNMLILHIPHASVSIPNLDGFCVRQTELEAEILKVTDWYTDELFQFEHAHIVKADFSRVFCDVERFLDDDKEEMSKLGRGVLYTKSNNGSVIRHVDNEHRNRIINDFYLPHHKRLSECVKYELENNKIALIIDCHSFPQIPLRGLRNQSPDMPDMCIGTDVLHSHDSLIKLTIDFFNAQGLKTSLNDPYSGCIVPSDYEGNEEVFSIMIEVNRKLYMNEHDGSKSEGFIKTKSMIDDYLKKVYSSMSFDPLSRFSFI